MSGARGVRVVIRALRSEEVHRPDHAQLMDARVSNYPVVVHVQIPAPVETPPTVLALLNRSTELKQKSATLSCVTRGTGVHGAHVLRRAKAREPARVPARALLVT